MPPGSMVAEHLPFLRRYARALTGNQREGDALVRATLEAAVTSLNARSDLNGGRIALYAAFTRLWQSAQVEHARSAGAVSHANAAHPRLAGLAPRQREALLLIWLEEFSSAEAGQIMGISTAQAAALAEDAMADVARNGAANVLIIEDEQLIAMQLEQVCLGIGLTLSGTATTRSQAVQLATAYPPGLVLADIQLADGSSGLDAVDDILDRMPDLPVIFITAYPERLLTGDRSEPTYLLSKPFLEDALRAAISQALFFAPSPSA